MDVKNELKNVYNDLQSLVEPLADLREELQHINPYSESWVKAEYAYSMVKSALAALDEI
jgi:hypothetical protein